MTCPVKACAADHDSFAEHARDAAEHHGRRMAASMGVPPRPAAPPAKPEPWTYVEQIPLSDGQWVRVKVDVPNLSVMSDRDRAWLTDALKIISTFRESILT